MKDLKKLKDLVLNEVEIYINENEDKFEFIVDFNNIDNWSFDEKDNNICLEECCNVFIRNEDDLEIENKYNDDNDDDEYNLKKIYLDDYILYIIS